MNACLRQVPFQDGAQRAKRSILHQEGKMKLQGNQGARYSKGWVHQTKGSWSKRGQVTRVISGSCSSAPNGLGLSDFQLILGHHSNSWPLAKQQLFGKTTFVLRTAGRWLLELAPTYQNRICEALLLAVCHRMPCGLGLSPRRATDEPLGSKLSVMKTRSISELNRDKRKPRAEATGAWKKYYFQFLAIPWPRCAA